MDVFIGLTVPQSRNFSKKYQNLPLKEIQRLLKSKIHEERLIALLILVSRFKKAEPADKKIYFDFYLKHTKHINSWDLIHKVSGWMLREVGKRVSEKDLRNFLHQYAHLMPRTMLRYSLEKLSAKERKRYMAL